MAFKIGKYIHKSLSDYVDLVAHIDEGIYPVIAPQDGHTKTPYVWYFVRDTSEESDKDGLAYDTDHVVIEVVSSSYDSLIEVCDLVREAMSLGFQSAQEADDTDYLIDQQTMMAEAEQYNDVDCCYSRKLVYEIITEQKK